MDSSETKEDDARQLIKQLSQVFEIAESESNSDDTIESIQIIEQILQKETEIKEAVEFEDDAEIDEVLKDVERIARDQDELDKIIEKSKKQKKSSNIIYLLKKDLPYTLKVDDVFNTNLRFIGLNRFSSEEAPEIEIYILVDDEEILLEEGKLKNFRSEAQAKNKFNNLIIKTHKIDFIGDEDTEIDIRIPKTTIKSSGADINKTGLEIAEDQLIQYLDAGFPVIYIDDSEEDKVDKIIRKAAVGRDIYEWNEAEGLLMRNDKREIFRILIAAGL